MVIVLLLAVSSAYGLHSLSQQQSWASAHSQLMPELQKAMQGDAAAASQDALRGLPPNLAKLYPLGIELANRRYEARTRCISLATEGVELFCGLGEDLLEGKRDSATVYKTANEACESLEAANRHYLDAHLDLSNWQGETYTAWNEVWPGHNLNLSLEGSRLYLDVNANRLAPVQQKVMQRQDAMYAPYRKGGRHDLPEDFDYETSEAINELFQLNNAVFAQAASADHGAAYIFRSGTSSWLARILARKNPPPAQQSPVVTTSQP